MPTNRNFQMYLTVILQIERANRRIQMYLEHMNSHSLTACTHQQAYSQSNVLLLEHIEQSFFKENGFARILLSANRHFHMYLQTQRTNKLFQRLR